MKKANRKKAVLSVLACLALVFALLPATVFAETGTAEVGTWDEFTAALADSGVTTITLTGDIASPQESGDLALVIGSSDRAVTITGGQITVKNAGIILGGDVTFQNIELYFASSVRNAILANGHSLTLDTVTNASEFDISLFCGGVTDYCGSNLSEIPAAGTNGHITIKGTNTLGNIYAGSLSDVVDGAADSPNEYTGAATITIASGASGMGSIYAHGAREDRSGGSYNVMLNDSAKYTVSGGVTINLSGSTPAAVCGATGGSANADVVYSGGANLISGLSFSDIASLTVSSGVLQPAALNEGVSLAIAADAELDLSVVIADDYMFTVGGFTGGGMLTMDSLDALKITGTVSGETAFQTTDNRPADKTTSGTVEDDFAYIDVSDSNGEGTFTFVPYSTQSAYTLEKINGAWTSVPGAAVVKPVSFSIEQVSVSATASELANNVLEVPVVCELADEENEWFQDVPLSIAVRKNDSDPVEAEEDSSGYPSVPSLGFDSIIADYTGDNDHGKKLQFYFFDTISAGTYTVSVTVTLSDDSIVTDSFTLTVTGCNGHTGGTATCQAKAVCETCGESYGEVDKTNHDSTVDYDNGFCPNGCYESAGLNADGCYEISNAGQLYWFAQQVNGGNNSINGKLTRDIVVNEGVLTESGELNGDGSSFRVWTPIGTSNDRYTGIFDGGSFTVSGLYFNDSDANEVGLFGYIGDAGAVHDLGVVNSYISGGNYVGGVVGYAIATVSVTNCYNSATVIGKDYVGGVVGNSAGPIANCYNSGTIRGTGTLGSVGGVVGQSFGTATNCHNTGDVTGSKFSVGGVVGTNYSGTVTNCYNSGAVSGSGNGVGGVAGSNTGSVTNCYNTGDVTGIKYYVGGVVGANSGGTVTNCYNTGSVTGSKYYVGGVVGNNYNSGTVTNCYYLTGCAKDGNDAVQFGIGSDTQGNTTADAEGVTTGRSDFSTGEVCYLLNGDQTTTTFKQTCGTGIPTFTGNTVYYGYVSCAADAEMVYTNNNGAAAEKPAHGNITYANKGSNHTWTCGICGDSGEEDHVHIDNKACICGKKITPVVTVTAASNLTYTGAAQNLVTAGSTTGGTLWYKVNDGEWSTTAPSATNADSYAVYYKVVGNENYEDVAAQSVTVTVTPMNVSGATVTLGTALTYTGTEQTQTVASVTLNGLNLTAGDYTITGNQQTGAGDYTLTITGKGNFTGTVTADWSIAKASMTITADNVTVLVGKDVPAEAALTYTVTGLVNGETADDALTKKPTLSYAEPPDTTQEGSYTINISGAEAANYTITYVTGTLTVSEKIPVTITVNLPTDLVYDGTDQSDRIKANITAVDAATGEEVTVAGYEYQFSADPINAGSYTLTVSVVDSDEQYVGSVNVSFTIAKRSLTLKADNKSAYVGDSEPEYTFTVTGLVTGHSLSGAVADCADADMTKTGTYDITVSIAGLVILDGETDVTANYEITTEKGTLTVRVRYIPPIIPDPEPEETVTVPVTDEENTVEVEVTVTEGKATVEDVDLEDLEKVVDGDSSTVTIDFSELDQKITEVELPREVVEKIAEAASESEQTLEIVLSDGMSIEFNASVLSEQVQQTGGISLTVSIVPHEDAKLTDAQKAAVGDRPAYDVRVTSDGKNISNMGGKITVTVPYELRNGEKGSGLVVYYVDDHGKRERCETNYDAGNKRLSWQTDHLSLYMLDYEESAVEACDGGESCPINAFTDTNSTAWYHHGIHFCVENGLMNGLPGDLFAPDGTTTRAQLITILWRLEGQPVVNYLMQFEDVAAEAWYTEAIRWAASEKIMGGYGNGKFGTEDAITREQMAATLYRYCQKKGIDVSVGEDTNILSYTDAFGISEYAIPAMQWACGSGVIGGIAEGDSMKLDPAGSATRAQIATILWRFCGNI